MAEVIVSSIVELISSTILEMAAEERTRFLGVKDKVESLQRKFSLMGGVLADEQEKREKSKELKARLFYLKEACLDMEDILDEWTTVIGVERDKGRATLWKKVRNFVSRFSLSSLGSRYNIAHNIEEINKILDELAQANSNRHQSTDGGRNRLHEEHSTARETTAYVKKSEILGREVEMGKLKNFLFGAGDEQIQTISLVGMGGLGKTALAQLVFNDDAVNKHFEGNVIWVCVSDDFNEKKVAKEIIEGLEDINGPAAHGLETESLQVLFNRISKSIKEKKFFLVLDDVWERKRDKWDQLRTCLEQGVGGSRILVTTRDAKVSAMMGSTSSQTINIERLSDEMCWSIIKQKALSGRPDDGSFEDIGMEIAVKCKGLPLAAKTLGSLLKSKESRGDWKRVLDDEIWNVKILQQDIFAPLMLSYYDLTPPVRQCFLFCAIYPKDHIIEVNPSLIYHWMSQGFLGYGSNNDDLERKGQEYFDILASRSLFQDFQVAENRITNCKMHDVVHELAQYLLNNEFELEVHSLNSMSPELRKSRHMIGQLSNSFDSSSISGVKKLRTLVISHRGYDDGLKLESLPSFLKKSKRLRLLNLSYVRGCIGRKVPDVLGKLIHLRHLDLSWTSVEHLPETLSRLRNLIFLDLHACEGLKELPAWIANLINLRFLRTSSCDALTKYPKEIRRMTSLRFLVGAIVRVDCYDAEELSIADLGNLRRLTTLGLQLKGDEINTVEVRKLQFVQFPDLQRLCIYLSGRIAEEDIRGALNPPPPQVKLEFYRDTSTLQFKLFGLGPDLE